MKLASTRLVTNNVSALAQFYQAITGISPVGSTDYLEFRTPGSVLALCSQRAVDIYNAGGASAGANRSAILEFQVEDVDCERTRIQNIVTKWILEPTDQPWGNRSMLFSDPDGNLINFFAPVRRAPA